MPKQNIVIFMYHPFLCVILVFLQGTTKVRSEAFGAVSKKKDLKDENLVFVARATRERERERERERNEREEE